MRRAVVGALVFGYITDRHGRRLVFYVTLIVSAAASSAYLTVSEIFPLETRALAIACFYALGTAIGGSIAASVWLADRIRIGLARECRICPAGSS